MHFVSLGPTTLSKKNIDAFKAAFAAARAQPKTGILWWRWAIGVQRHIFVDETDENARVAKPAMEHHLKNINWLREKHGVSGPAQRLNAFRGANFEESVADGSAIAGSPKTVLAEIERQVAELGINYLLTYLFLGNMTLRDAQRSLGLFSTEVMPKLAKL